MIIHNFHVFIYIYFEMDVLKKIAKVKSMIICIFWVHAMARPVAIGEFNSKIEFWPIFANLTKIRAEIGSL